MRRSLIPVVLLAALSFFGGLGRGAIADNDEAFYAEAAREMVASSDWLTPFYNYELRFQKPILFYWLVAIAYKAAGIGEVWFNPGADAPSVLAKARALGIRPIQACSILGIGMSPSEF